MSFWQQYVPLVSSLSDCAHDDEDDPTDDVGNVAEDMAKVLDVRHGHFAQIVVVAHVHVAAVPRGSLMAENELQDGHRVEGAHEEDDPDVERRFELQGVGK